MTPIINIMIMLATFLVGLLLGGFFFGGLLWTVRRGLLSKRPGLWFLISGLVRIGVVLGAFYALLDGSWERLMIGVAGFLIARMIIIRLSRTGGQYAS